MDIRDGDIYFKLTVVREVDRVSKDKRRFLCKCECGKFKEINLIHLTNGKNKSCGCSSKEWHHNNIGDKSPGWKGGRRIESGGYVEVYDPTHPKSRVNGYVKEHRVIMEKFLNRYLFDHENVHHINGDKLNNKIDNLELWSSSQPPGQRIVDKVKWAMEILNIYSKLC